MDELFIYTDGGSRGNPGKSAIGIVILDKNNKIILTHKEFLGIGTNNQAEYKALIKAFGLIKKFSAKNVHFFSDSELMVKQLNGKYKVNSINVKPLYEKAKSLASEYESIEFNNVRRSNEFISIADSLVNSALDEN